VSSSCRHCAAPLLEMTWPSGEHREGPVRASAEARRVLSCSRGCRGAASDSSSGLVEATRRALLDGLITARPRRTRRRLWRAAPDTVRGADPATGPGDRCGACASVLGMPLRATSRAVTVEPAGSAPFTVMLDLPLGRCPDCGGDNLPAALARALERAALSAVGMPISPRRRRAARGSPRPA
jgi:hypothetical protein